MAIPAPDRTGPRLLDAVSLLSQVTDEVVVRTVRDTHLAWADRVHGVLRRRTGGASALPEAVHRGIASGVYAGLGAGLRVTASGLEALADRNVGPGLESTPRGRWVTSAVNGIIGDRVARERPRLAMPMAVRVAGADVPLQREAIAEAFPHATGAVVVLLHGLSENEAVFDLHRDTVGTTYAETLTEMGWTPVFVRTNSGLPVRENGAALAALLQHLVDDWPVEVGRIALVGHSMGGLVARAACAVVADVRPDWTDLVTDVVSLGTPHLGAPLARGVGHGARALALLPETAAFGRILDQRSVGVLDLVEGLGEDVPPLPRARHHLVSATLTRSPRHPFARVAGDLLVTMPSAYGRPVGRPPLFPGADELHLPGVGHFALVNHPEVHRALRTWLAPRRPRRAG